MKLQHLAIIFIIIMLPISILLGEYTSSKVETLRLQSTYDSKLKDATYDALKAYQLNSINSDLSDYANSKIRDIKAAANTFFNSVATNFSLRGYDKEALQNYVPALVFTMYDGYYIYSPYENTWDQQTKNQQEDQISFKDGEILYGLKPYIYYSCRYKKSDIDVVITYALDNYITIQGKIGNEVVNKSGYIISGVEKVGGIIRYKGNEITTENKLKEKVNIDGTLVECQYIRINGTKYYTDPNTGEKFVILNNKKVTQNIELADMDHSALRYYSDAYDMRVFIEQNNLTGLRVSDAVDENGNKYLDQNKTPYSIYNQKIFDYDNNKGIESQESNFNEHRMDVIKHSIERNLSIAITNYNNYSKSTTNFQMPELKQADWMKIMDNMSIITFLQGLNIGGKIYNGYSVVTNTKNKEVVAEDTIYIKTSDGKIHTRNCKNLQNIDLTNALGFSKVDLERKTAQDVNGQNIYFFPKYAELDYDCLVNSNEEKNNDWENNVTLFNKYYTALGRERYSQYREVLLSTNIQEGMTKVTLRSFKV